MTNLAKKFGFVVYLKHTIKTILALVVVTITTALGSHN